MNEEMKKVEILSRMFHRLNLSQLETFQQMGKAMINYENKPVPAPVPVQPTRPQNENPDFGLKLIEFDLIEM